jgi:hypothetical protein
MTGERRKRRATMSYQRGRWQDAVSTRQSSTTRSIAPGKTTLTEGLMQQNAYPGVEPAMHSGIGGGDAGAVHPGTGGSSAEIASPSGGDVAATVVGSAADSESALDGSFTPALVTALQATPHLNIDEVLYRLVAAPLGTGTDNGGDLQHPTIVQYGQAAQHAPGGADGRDHKKLAILIANQHYVHINGLYTPIAEADTMKAELASRGYDANVHADKTAADMTSLWGSMVGAANRGDDLMAFYGGHGMPEGLLGVNHDGPPNPPDVYTNHQVSGVVSAATSKGAHIRFVMDSCHSGAAAQAVREVRENELAAAAGSAGGPLQVAALTGLRKAKERLLAHLAQRETMHQQLLDELRHREARAPAVGNARASRDLVAVDLDDALTRLPNAFERATNQLWAEYVPMLETVRAAVGHRQAPPPITDYVTLGAQLNYLDDLWISVSQAMERAAAEGGAAKPVAS